MVHHEALSSRLSSRPDQVRRQAWAGGAFIAAYRPFTAFVDGEIFSDSHLVMVTLKGGARRHQKWTDAGIHSDGPDRPGAVSFLPAQCRRRLRIHDVEWQWAALSLDPASPAGAALASLPPFDSANDAFLTAMLAEFERLSCLGELDAFWCESMTSALVSYILRSTHCQATEEGTVRGARLAPWQLRKVRDFVRAHISDGLRIGDLAAQCNLSEGHFHRAFRASTGLTPLQYVTAQRVEEAKHLLSRSAVSIEGIAAEVGFANQSHFARIFRSATRYSPLAWRRCFGLPAIKQRDGDTLGDSP